jgi:hypothetical protein
MSYRGVVMLIATINQAIDYNFTENEVFLNKLRGIGIKNPKVMVTPLDYKDVEFPKDFTVCLDSEIQSAKFVDDIAKAMPDIKFYNSQKEDCKIADIACYVGVFGEFYNADNFKKFITAGRYAITNFQLPYSGYITEDRDVSKYKVKVIEKIRELQKKYESGERNTMAMDYWRTQTDKVKFNEKLKSLVKVVAVNG